MENIETKPTPVAREKFEQVLQHLGIEWLPQSGFHKVLGPKGYRIYVANTKTVARVDLSGFEVPFGTRSPAQGVFGNVRQQLEMRGLGEEDILRNFAAVCEHMMGLTPAEPKAKKEAKGKAPKAAGAEVKTDQVLPDDEASKEARAKRLELIKRVAAEKGAKVSEKTLAEATEQEPTEAELEAATAPEAQA